MEESLTKEEIHNIQNLLRDTTANEDCAPDECQLLDKLLEMYEKRDLSWGDEKVAL